MNVLKEKHNNIYNYSKEIFADNKIYPFNMVIANRKYYNEYSEWLFNILFEVETRVGNMELDEYQTRYTGFLSERLFTLYIMYHQIDVHECILIDEEGEKISPSILRKIRNNTYYKIFGG